MLARLLVALLVLPALSTPPAVLAATALPARANALTATMRWSTLIGGSAADVVTATVVDGSGNTILVGYSASTDFPVTSAGFQRTNHGANDAVVAKVRPDGSLAWSTYLGGSADDAARGVATDAAGNVYVTGETSSPDFPVTAAALQTRIGSSGPSDAFVTKLTADGAVAYSTYLGGTSAEYGRAVAVDAAGQATIAGYSGSSDFPTTAGVVKASHTSSFWDGSDGFVTRLNAAGSGLVYSTYLGSEGGTDVLFAMAMDGAGAVTVTGWTASGNFPTTSGAYQHTFQGVKDVFVTRLNPTATSYTFSTLLGGTGNDDARAVALDGVGNAVVVGMTGSTDFPVTSDGLQRSLAGAGSGTLDAFVTKISPTGGLAYSTYLGGAGNDAAYAVCVAGDGSTVLAGSTAASFPSTSGSYAGGAWDAFLTVLSPSNALAYSSCVGSAGSDQGLGLAMGADQTALIVGSTDGSYPTTSGALKSTMNGSGGDGFATRYDLGLGHASGITTLIPSNNGPVRVAPNPFARFTRLSYTVTSPSADVAVSVFDLAGRLVRMLVNAPQAAGEYDVNWDGRDEGGRAVVRGMYFVHTRIDGSRSVVPIAYVP